MRDVLALFVAGGMLIAFIGGLFMGFIVGVVA